MDKQAQQTILVDLDGTLAEYKGWNGHTHIGDPVPIMARRIRRWLNDGKLVKIFTARFAEKDPKKRQEIVDAIQRWTQKHFGRKLKVTNEKDKSVTKIWDDRAMSVTRNKGRQTKLDYHEKHAALDPEQEETLRYSGGAALGGLLGGAVAGPGGAGLGALLGLAGLYGYRRMNPSEAAAGAAKVADPLMAIGSDGSIRTFGEGTPNPRSYTTFPLIFRKYVRGETRPEEPREVGKAILTMQDAVRKLTSLPAETLGLKDRGLNDPRLEGEGFRGCRLEIDCRRRSVRLPVHRCTRGSSRL
jgi:hypothetical protein